MVAREFCSVTGKECFGSRREASRALRSIHAAGRIGSSNKVKRFGQMAPYECQHCAEWHLGTGFSKRKHSA